MLLIGGLAIGNRQRTAVRQRVNPLQQQDVRNALLDIHTTSDLMLAPRNQTRLLQGEFACANSQICWHPACYDAGARSAKNVPGATGRFEKTVMPPASCETRRHM